MSPSLRPRTNINSLTKSTATLGSSRSPYFSSRKRRSAAAIAAVAAIPTTLKVASTTTSAQGFAIVAGLVTTPNSSNNVFSLKSSSKATTTFGANNKLSIPENEQTKRSRKKKKSPTMEVVVAAATATRANNNNTKKKKRQHGHALPLTTSFPPVWCGRWDDIPTVPVHTLILGTHPSIKSLEEQQYFGHEQNAFWWIAGDCLGFRRRTGISPLTGKPYAIVKHLRYDTTRILPYQEQEKVLVRHGFALWDIVGTCRRPGSLDQDIYDEQPNSLWEFALQHQTSLKRIVFANGGTGCNIFKKHFKGWLGSGELQALPDHEPSEKMFATAIAREEKLYGTNAAKTKKSLICAMSVSPAAATYSYVQKRDAWEEFVYQPGLADLNESSHHI